MEVSLDGDEVRPGNKAEVSGKMSIVDDDEINSASLGPRQSFFVGFKTPLLIKPTVNRYL